MSIYNQRQEDDMISRLIGEAQLSAAPRPPVRLYVDPAGGFLRDDPASRGGKARTADKVRCMAGMMARYATGDGACTVDHLRAGGFSEEEISLYRDAAASLAARTMGGANA